MLDLIDRFVMFLLNEFYEHLEEELTRYSQSLTVAIKEHRDLDAERYLKWIKETRDQLADLSDENMELKDFVGLVAEKYGFVREGSD